MCFFSPPQYEIHNKCIDSAFELDSMQRQVGLLHIPVSTHPLLQSKSKTQFITNASLALSQSVWMVYSFHTANYFLEAKVTRSPSLWR